MLVWSSCLSKSTETLKRPIEKKKIPWKNRLFDPNYAKKNLKSQVNTRQNSKLTSLMMSINAITLMAINNVNMQCHITFVNY